MWKWVRSVVRNFINPFDLFMIFSTVTVFFKLTMLILVLRFTLPNFIKRRWMVIKSVVRDQVIITEIEIAIQVNKLVTNIKHHQAIHHCQC